MRISDWSSDVCSSDLIVGAGAVSLPSVYAVDAVDPIAVPARTAPSVAPASARAPPTAAPPASIVTPDRKSVVEGKSVSVRVDLGVRRIIKITHIQTN